MRVEEAAQHLSALRIPDNRLQNVKLKIRAKSRSGNIVLRGEELKIGYPTKALFDVEELELRRLECAALIGPNGSGKTTFLRTILKKIEPLAGELRLGASLKVGYFAQAHEDLDPNLTLIEEIDKMGTGMLEREIRGHLGSYLFSGDDHYKKVSVLSGGERGRLALAKLSLLDANLLLLDEPSNHLDIPAQEILQQVLADFNGTILMVSHDRYLIDALATQVWEILPEAQNMNIFLGGYSQYRGLDEEQTGNGKAELSVEENITTSAEPQPAKKSGLSKHEKKRQQARVIVLEDHILNLEAKLETLSQKLQNPPTAPDAITQLGEDYAYTEAELADALAEWEELAKRLEAE